ncbi:MAG: tripartite tricarboxylate transporter substrate binding protein [Firmicutes bacterium]|nr:tripartite tricarboxylate transporter substrate binding protein [Bacillota bacterium]
MKRTQRGATSVRALVVLVTMALVFSVSGCGKKTEVKYPERTVNVIVGWAAGGPTDLVARGLAPLLQAKLGQPFVVTNMAGAAGSVGADNVSKQSPDGYTLLFGSETMSVWQVMGTVPLSYKNFEVAAVVAEAIPALIVPADSPYKDLKELVEDAKKRPEAIKMSTAGPGTVPHVCGLMLSKYLGAKMSFIPFQGGAPAVTAVIGKQVDLTTEMLQTVLPHHKAGKARILATFTNESVAQLQDVPALGEIYPEMKPYLPYGPWFGVLAPKGTPKEVIQRLATAIDECLKDPKWKTHADNIFVRTLNITDPAKISAHLDKWTSDTAWLLYDLGIAKESPEKFGIPKPK